ASPGSAPLPRLARQHLTEKGKEHKKHKRHKKSRPLLVPLVFLPFLHRLDVEFFAECRKILGVEFQPATRFGAMTAGHLQRFFDDPFFAGIQLRHPITKFRELRRCTRERGRQILGTDVRRRSECDRTFDDVLQLPYIAWPIVGQEDLANLWSDSLNARVRTSADVSVFLDELRDEQRDVVAPVGKPWHLNANLVQAEIEVSSEPSFLN